MKIYPIVRPKTLASEQPLNYSLKTECLGYHHGQTDCVIYALLPNGKIIGKLQFSVFEDIPRIEWIEVAPYLRRRGIATSLVNDLKAQYEDTKIEWSLTTPEGSKLYESMSED